MFCSRILSGASALALHSALLAVCTDAAAQTAAQTLPGITVEAPRRAQASPRKKRSVAHRDAPRSSPRPQPAVVVRPSPVSTDTQLAILHQAPTGQPQTTIGRDLFANRPSFSVADVLRDSPGISIKQGNGPRDFGISIRGSNARNGFAIRNLVIFDDGFPVTQPDGLSRSDLIDPRAYGAIDVIRGPSSALYGNYATGGALNFRTRRGAEINGVEYGVDAGSYGYLNNYLTAGKKVGNFEGSLFASDARGDGFLGNSWFNTQTVNFLGTLQATPDDRFTFKLINNTLDTRLPIRSSLNQFYINPFQRGCETAATAAPGCGTITLFNNGFNAANGISRETAEQARLGRNDRRTIVGGRWEHDFDNQTTWRNQFVFDDRNINQPTGTTSAIGDYPSYNFMSDLVRRSDLLGMDSTSYLGAFYNTLSWSGDTYSVAPGGTRGRLQSNVTGEHTNYGVRAREELRLTNSWTAIAGIGWETTHLNGVNTSYTYTGQTGITTTTIRSTDRQFQNTAPEFALQYRADKDWLLRARVATGYGTPQVGNLFVLPNGQNGNNTQLNPQKNLGYDLGFDWTPDPTIRVSATGFYEFFRDELVTQATPLNSPNSSYTFNAPKSEHRGFELLAQWRFLPSWRVTTAYTYLDQIYTSYTENITNGVFGFNRAGNKIPGISPNELTARLSYDQLSGALKGVGAFVEFQWRDAFYMDNANLLKAPGYELVNLNLHYDKPLQSEYLNSLHAYFEVRNVFDRTYVASANNIANTVTGAGVQNPASVLANTGGSIYAGSPRMFIAGMRFAFR
ncbi:TonB-dependent receptor family protein [Nitrobacter sp. TKz-YC02]|uniref:TonB-dependent receptor family protein n=1 Tax=Nitrobacter sp. TKz-YC02 TaxID=3398704 RepID=UPI003CEEC5AD